MEQIRLYMIFAAGVMAAGALHKIAEIAKKISMKRDRLKQFKEVLENINQGKSVFVSRLNQTVMVDTKVKDYGTVNIVYLMDKKVVCIFKENKCLHTSEEMKEMTEKIEVAISRQYGRQIDDVVTVLGVTISREEIESKIELSIDELKKMAQEGAQEILSPEKSDVRMIIEENEALLDTDSILDKISRSGMKSLTKEELDFLKNQSSR